jgi:4-hydroxybenzoate polyprenyltransferase
MPDQATQKPRYQVIDGRVVDVNQASPNKVADQPPKWQRAARLMRLDKPVGILLLLWPTLAALFLAAEAVPSVRLLIVFTLGVVLTRSAGCVINDYADRWLDARVQRTQNRVLASNQLSATFALKLFLGLMLAAFALVCLTNTWTIAWSLFALLIACAYPYCKRYTYYPQAVLGLAFSVGILMAFSAYQKWPTPAGWLLFCGNVLWTMGYDTVYAMIDREDDLQAGAKSTAILFGELDLIAIGVLYALAVLCFALMGLRAAFHWPFYLGLAGFSALCAWQIWHARTRAGDKCFQAFLSNQYAGLALFLGTFAGLMFTSSPN